MNLRRLQLLLLLVVVVLSLPWISFILNGRLPHGGDINQEPGNVEAKSGVCELAREQSAQPDLCKVLRCPQVSASRARLTSAPVRQGRPRESPVGRPRRTTTVIGCRRLNLSNSSQNDSAAKNNNNNRRLRHPHPNHGRPRESPCWPFAAATATATGASPGTEIHAKEHPAEHHLVGLQSAPATLQVKTLTLPSLLDHGSVLLRLYLAPCLLRLPLRILRLFLVHPLDDLQINREQYSENSSQRTSVQGERNNSI